MAVEPLNTIMTYQAQPVAQQNTPVQKAAETMEGQVIEANAPKVDKQTIALSKTNNDSEESEDSQGKQEFDQELMRKAMKEINKKASNVEAEFGIHEKTNRITIKMVDKETKKVIKELPPEKMLDMVARIWEMAGLMVDEKR